MVLRDGPRHGWPEISDWHDSPSNIGTAECSALSVAALTPRGQKNGSTKQTEKRFERLLSARESEKPGTQVQLVA